MHYISIGRERIFADRVMFMDFDHGVVDVDRPLREAIYCADVRLGHNVRIGYGMAILHGASCRRECWTDRARASCAQGCDSRTSRVVEAWP